jgi:polyketide cyclase/dehydrase/lipid transport protein
MSLARQQAFIDAPVSAVWELLADVDRHPEWWPRVVEVECDGLEAGCTYRQVTQTPFGKDEMNLLVDGLDECRNLSIHCLSTGTFVRWQMAEAQGGTFLQGEMGMEPEKLRMKTFDLVIGRIYFRSWLRQTMEALERVAPKRAGEEEQGAKTEETAAS